MNYLQKEIEKLTHMVDLFYEDIKDDEVFGTINTLYWTIHGAITYAYLREDITKEQKDELEGAIYHQKFERVNAALAGVEID